MAVIMQTLVLGGTAWLGGHVASAALEREHQVMCWARGFSGAVPEGVELVRADRSRPAAYDALKHQQWDVVVDVARQPGQVRSAVRALADRAGVYVFASSGNVYADHRIPGADEEAPLLPPLTGEVMESMDTYGQAKVACEQQVQQAFEPERTLIAGVGLIGGPGDIFDRSWVLAAAVRQAQHTKRCCSGPRRARIGNPSDRRARFGGVAHRRWQQPTWWHLQRDG